MFMIQGAMPPKSSNLCSNDWVCDMGWQYILMVTPLIFFTRIQWLSMNVDIIGCISTFLLSLDRQRMPSACFTQVDVASPICRISATSPSRWLSFFWMSRDNKNVNLRCVEQREFSLGLMWASLKAAIKQPPQVEICSQVHINRTRAK